MEVCSTQWQGEMGPVPGRRIYAAIFIQHAPERDIRDYTDVEGNEGGASMIELLGLILTGGLTVLFAVILWAASRLME